MAAADGDDSAVYAPGDLVAGRYRIDSVLGKGGMGMVYRAEHIKLGRTVALKVLLPKYAEHGEVVARFLQEARAAASIGHPGIVEVFDLGDEEKATFLAMELLDGEELFERIQRAHPLSVDNVLGIGIDLADAVAAAHEHGIVHRDLKPQNVFLAKHGRREIVKVLDFGIAKLMEADRPDTPMTRTGQVMGTPLYMAPEQLRGTPVDARTDVYAIGAILYEALTGRPPYSATTYPELVLKVTQEAPNPIARYRKEVPPNVIAVVRKAMQKQAEDRFQSASELMKALERAQRGEEPIVEPIIAAEPNPFAHTEPSNPGISSPEQREPLIGTQPLPEVVTETPFATESMRPSAPTARSRSGIGAAIAGVVVVLLAAGGIVAWQFGTSQPEPPPDADVAPASPPPPDTVPSGVDTPPEPEPVPEAPAVRRVRFTSDPDGVEIRDGENLVCTTPCEANLDDETVTLTARRRGLRTDERTLEAPLPEEVHFELRSDRPRPPTSTMMMDALPPLMTR